MRTWDIKRTLFSVGDFTDWQRSGTLELSPSFQRRSVWTKPQKSYFVDTVYRGLPVPIIFLREKTDIDTLKTIREVIDGQQRLRTMIAFVAPDSFGDFNDRDDFVVQGKHNTEIAGKPFRELHEGVRRRLLSYEFSVHVLPSDTSDADVLKIFARMNSTGSTLNDQELRNAEFFGEFKAVSYDLALSQLERWRDWNIFSEQEIARMQEVELTSELLIYINEGFFQKSKKKIDSYYEKYDEVFATKGKISSTFSLVMDDIDQNCGDLVADSAFAGRILFFQLFVFFRRLRADKITISKPLVRRLFDVAAQLRTRVDLPDDVAVALAGRSTHAANREKLHNFIWKHVVED